MGGDIETERRENVPIASIKRQERRFRLPPIMHQRHVRRDRTVTHHPQNRQRPSVPYTEKTKGKNEGLKEGWGTHPLIVSSEIVSEMLNVPETSASEVLTDSDEASIDCMESIRRSAPRTKTTSQEELPEQGSRNDTHIKRNPTPQPLDRHPLKRNLRRHPPKRLIEIRQVRRDLLHPVRLSCPFAFPALHLHTV